MLRPLAATSSLCVDDSGTMAYVDSNCVYTQPIVASSDSRHLVYRPRHHVNICDVYWHCTEGWVVCERDCDCVYIRILAKDMAWPLPFVTPLVLRGLSPVMDTTTCGLICAIQNKLFSVSVPITAHSPLRVTDMPHIRQVYSLPLKNNSDDCHGYAVNVDGTVYARPYGQLLTGYVRQIVVRASNLWCIDLSCKYVYTTPLPLHARSTWTSVYWAKDCMVTRIHVDVYDNVYILVETLSGQSSYYRLVRSPVRTVLPLVSLCLQYLCVHNIPVASASIPQELAQYIVVES